MNVFSRSIPNAITCCNLISGCLATVMAFRIGHEYFGIDALAWFYIFVLASAVFDFCDGLSARSLHAYSAMGKELDSLSDLVSFGVAPGMLILNLMDINMEWKPLAFVGILIPVMGALRLAKFNVDDTQTTSFSGLPIPANALFWIGFSGFISRYGYPGDVVTVGAVVIISLMMVAPVRMFSLKFKNLSFAANVKRYGIVIAAVAFIIIYGLTGLMWTIIMYILLSVFTKEKQQ